MTMRIKAALVIMAIVFVFTSASFFLSVSIRNTQNGLLIAAVFFLVAGVIGSIFVSEIAIRPFIKIEAQNHRLEKLYNTIQTQAEQIKNEHERARTLLNATPLACRLWNRDFKILSATMKPPSFSA